MNTTIEFLNQSAGCALNFAWAMFWQSSLLIGGLFVLDWLLRRKLRAAVLYALWLSVLVKLLLPPSFAFPSGAAWWLRQPAAAQQTQSRPAVVVTHAAGTIPSLPRQSIAIPLKISRVAMSSTAWAFVVSICTSFGLLGWMLLQWRRVTDETRRGETVPSWITEVLDDARRSAGLRQGVRLRIIDCAVSPAVCGMVHPLILLPRTLVEQLTARQLRAILLHEVIHIRRGDVWINCVQALLQIVYWWHPLLWLANARIRHAREEAVDDAVMQTLRNEADAYAPTLLQVAKLVLQRPLASLGLVGILESHSLLRRRIERLIDFRPPPNAGLTLASALCVLAFAALALPMGRAPANAPVPKIATAVYASVALSPKLPSPNIERDPRNAGLLVQDAELLFEIGELNLSTNPQTELVKLDPKNQADAHHSNLAVGTDSKPTSSGDIAASQPPAGSNFHNRTNLNKARTGLMTKLTNTRIDHVQFDNLSLGAVVRYLNDETHRLDPIQRGISFLINSASNTGSGAAGLGDLSSVSIRILPSLTDVRFADLLDAIVKVADKPIQYSVGDNAIMFGWKANEPAPLYTRMIKVDPYSFNHGLERVTGKTIPPASVNKTEAKQALLVEFLGSSGLELKPPKSLIFDDAKGTLLAHATLADLDALEAIVNELDTEPPQVNIKVRFFEVPEEFAGPVWSLLNGTNQPNDSTGSLTAVLTPPQWSVLRKTMESSSEVNFLNEASVTTLSGRQFQVQVVDLKSIATNINPQALNPPGVSTPVAGGGGIYQEGSISLGPTLDAIPWVLNDSRQIQVDATASVNEVSYYDPTNEVKVYVDGIGKFVPFALPHFRVTRMIRSAMVYDGQALVLGSKMEEPWPDSGRPGSKRKRLLAVITPTVLDSAGNRVHAETDRPRK